jgi:hypothetical protein
VTIGSGTLEQRLAALEQYVETLAQSVQGEQLVPNYLTVNPDGTTGASFTGHVHAQGLDLDAGTGATPPSTDQVRWLRTSDGAAVATVGGFDQAGLTELLLQAIPSAGSQVGGVRLTGTAIAGSPQFSILDITRGKDLDSDSVTSINGTCGNKSGLGGLSFVVGNALGQSSFLQQPTPTTMRVQAGATTITLAANTFTNFALPTAWLVQHLCFIASISPGAVQPKYGSIANGIVNGAIFSDTAGVFNIDWVSFGH